MSLDKYIHEDVLSGGVAVSNTVYASGIVSVDNGGVTIEDTISSGGGVYVSSGGRTTDGDILSGGGEYVEAGGAAHELTVSAGGSVDGAGTLYGGVYDGSVSGVTLADDFRLSGTIIDTINVSTTANAYLTSVALAASSHLYLSGAYVTGLVVASGAQVLMQGGTLDDVAVDGGEIDVYSGGVTTATLSSGASLILEDLDSAVSGNSITVSRGGELVVTDGYDVDAVVSAGGELLATGADGVDREGQIASGGLGVIANDATASGTLVMEGGILSVTDATADYTTVSGLEVVVSGAIYSASVESGGVLSLGAGVVVSGGCFVYGGGTLELASNSVAQGVTLNLSKTYTSAVFDGVTVAGGSLIIDQTTVSSGGVFSLEAGTKTGEVTVASGGVVSGAGELGGGAVDLDDGLVSGVALGDAVGGYSELIVASGAVTSAVREIGADDQLIVQSEGLAVKTRVTGGQATLLVQAGGVASGTLLAGLGTGEVIYGRETAAVVSSGGTEFVASGGVASGTRAFSGGAISIGAGGSAVNIAIAARAVVIDGGVLVHGGAATTFAGVLSGKGKLIQAGPGKLVLNGTASGFTGETIISAGVVELATSAGPKGAMLFTGSGGLEIDAADRPAGGTTFSETLSNFDAYGDTLTLAGLTMSNGATATLSGTTLTVVNGGYTAKFKLAGSAANAYVVGSNGTAGLLIRAASGASVSPLVHAIASFDAGTALSGETAILSAADAPFLTVDAATAGASVAPGRRLAA